VRAELARAVEELREENKHLRNENVELRYEVERLRNRVTRLRKAVNWLRGANHNEHGGYSPIEKCQQWECQRTRAVLEEEQE